MSDRGSPPVAVVTGASSGIGKAAAKTLAAQGWRVIGLGRDPARSAAAAAEIGAMSRYGDTDMIIADLALLRDAARAAREIAARTGRIDVLINNAGGVAAAQRITDEGNEATFAGNHLGPFLLTNQLLPLLCAAAAEAPLGRTRVIVTSSSGHEFAPGLNWSDLQMRDDFVAGAAYCNAKLANILFARGLATRVAGDHIVVHAMHPGVVNTNFVNHADAAMQAYMNTLDAQTPEAGADTLVWLATAEEAGQSTGGYFHKREAVPCSEASQNAALAERLWQESEKLVEGFGGREEFLF